MSIFNSQLITLIALALVILPLLTAIILRHLGNYTKQQLVNNFGFRSQIILGGLGVIVHELAHLVTALVFGHQIGRFKLLEPRTYRLTGTLGYVQHYWNRQNFYENLGNFFIGLAPCFFCSEGLWLIHGLLFDTPIINYGQSKTFSEATQTALANIEHPFGPLSWRLLIYIILIVMIASTGYGLSRQDFQNAMNGLIYWGILAVIIYFFVILSGIPPWFVNLMWFLVIIWLTFLGRGLIYLVTSLVVIKGISFL